MFGLFDLKNPVLTCDVVPQAVYLSCLHLSHNHVP